MWVTIELEGEVTDKGILLGMDFAQIKAGVRGYLDGTYDHHLLLNEKDNPDWELPGRHNCEADPTTENIARWIGEWATDAFGAFGLHRVKVEVWETAVNCATWEAVLEAWT
jgi:6-pyruvoyl-tetrahydropterin synthase